MKKLYLSLFLFINANCNAQDLRSGELSFSNFTGDTYEIFVRVYSEVNTAVPRTNFFLAYGDGTYDSVPCPTPVIVANNIYIYEFFIYHTYPGIGVYIIHFESDFYADSINNLPNSVHVPLYMETELISSNVIYNEHSPATPLTQQFYFPCCNTIVYNQHCSDADGDSLSYELISPDSAYSFAGATIDGITGDLTFTPPQKGKYLFDVKVKEWRIIDSTIVNIGYTLMPLMWNVGDETGIAENNNSTIVEVFPTLVNDLLTIRSKESLSGFGVIIDDMQGKRVLSDANFSSGNESILQLSSLSPGVYLLRIISSEGTNYVQKFFKI